MLPISALEAIVARINGVYDNPHLKSFGPLSTSITDDVLKIATNAIKKEKTNILKQDSPLTQIMEIFKKMHKLLMINSEICDSGIKLSGFKEYIQDGFQILKTDMGDE